MKIKLLFFLLISTFNLNAQLPDSISIAREDTLQRTDMEVVTVKTSRSRAGVFFLKLPSKILATETLNKTILRCEFITTDNAQNFYFKGKKIHTILLNGNPITPEEFQKLPTDSLYSLQIDMNYFNQSSGETQVVMKITDKRNHTNHVNGSMDFSQGFLQTFNYYGLNLNTKIRKFSSKLFVTDVVNTTRNSTQQELNNISFSSQNVRKLAQPYFGLQTNFEINKKNNISIRNRYSVVSDNTISEFSDATTTRYGLQIKSYNLNLRYDKLFNSKYSLKCNADYLDNRTDLRSELNNLSFRSDQKFNELTFSPQLLYKTSRFTFTHAIIGTNRFFDFTNTAAINSITQQLLTYFGAYSRTVNDNHSFFVSVKFQADQSNKQQHIRYYFLPQITYLFKVAKIGNAELSYNRKIQRPGIRTLSGASIIDPNGNAINYQDFLFPQIDNTASLDFSRDIKNVSINLNASYTFSQNALITFYSFTSGPAVNSSTNNSSYLTDKTIRASLSFSVWKDARMNLNYFVSGIKMKNGNEQSSGIINGYDVSLSGPVFKSYLVSLTSFYISRFYDFNVYTMAYPDITASISKNYLKDKLQASIEIRNILGQESNRTMHYAHGVNTYSLANYNQSRLLLFSVTYLFGKDLNIPIKSVQNTNNDMRP